MYMNICVITLRFITSKLVCFVFLSYKQTLPLLMSILFIHMQSSFVHFILKIPSVTVIHTCIRETDCFMSLLMFVADIIDTVCFH